ncbi:MAG: hypothetical protein OZ919_00685 [Xanthomonadaceae bacterium]|nr:hypothetical protein [Xanthomonadaceae bacterium]
MTAFPHEARRQLDPCHRRRNAMGRDAYLWLPRTQDADLRQRGAFVGAACAASASSR